MKSISILFLSVFVTVGLFAQSGAYHPSYLNETYIPKTLSASTAMSARTLSTTYDDTTQGFQVRRFSKVYIGLVTAANDSARVLLSYAQSDDGQTYSNYVLWDSLSTTGTVDKVKYFELPADVMGAYSVRIRAFGNADVNRYSANPSTTLTVKIIRKQH